MRCGKKRGIFFPNAHLWKKSTIHFGASEELARRLCGAVAAALRSQETETVKILSHSVPFVVTRARTAQALVEQAEAAFIISITAETVCLFGSRHLLERLGGATQLTSFPSSMPVIVVAADAKVQNADGPGEPCASASDDEAVTPFSETADDQVGQLQGSASIVLEGAATGDIELEQLQAVSPAWSDSTSASTEVMYSMPRHAPRQNVAQAYDSHSYFDPQELSFSDPLILF